MARVLLIGSSPGHFRAFDSRATGMFEPDAADLAFSAVSMAQYTASGRRPVLSAAGKPRLRDSHRRWRPGVVVGIMPFLDRDMGDEVRDVPHGPNGNAIV